MRGDSKRDGKDRDATLIEETKKNSRGNIPPFPTLESGELPPPRNVSPELERTLVDEGTPSTDGKSEKPKEIGTHWRSLMNTETYNVLESAIEKAKSLSQSGDGGAGLLGDLSSALDSAALLDIESQNYAIKGFKILEKLGRGSTGVVYKAVEEESGKIVALKVISPEYLSNEKHIQRFKLEIEITASLKHPNIAQILKVGSQKELVYIVMEFIDGKDFGKLIENGPLEPNRAAELILQAAEVLDYIHKQGVLHRDIKPSNLLLDKNGKVWITDFGVAKLLTNPSMAITASGALLGTPSYMSPEQVSGKSYSLGPNCDIYSLGAVLYSLLTARPPICGSSPYETIQKVLYETPPPPRRYNPKVPRPLEAICMKCLEKHPRKRYNSAAELASELRAFLEGREVKASPPSFWKNLLESQLGDTLLGPEVLRVRSKVYLIWSVLSLAIMGTIQLLISMEIGGEGLYRGIISAGLLVAGIAAWLKRTSEPPPLIPLEKKITLLSILFVVAILSFVGIERGDQPFVSQLNWLVFSVSTASLFISVFIDFSFLVLTVLLLFTAFSAELFGQYYPIAIGSALAVGFFVPYLKNRQ